MKYSSVAICLFFCASARLLHHTLQLLKVHWHHQRKTVLTPLEPYPNLLHLPLRQNIRRSKILQHR